MIKQASQNQVSIVGAGIVGLALAWMAARKGYRVRVFESASQAYGASIRNFGLLWPIGQKQGLLRQRALRSLIFWQEIASEAKIPLISNGSLHLAYENDELQVLEEFLSQNTNFDYQLLTKKEIPHKSSAANPKNLKAGLWSPYEATVDPRLAIQQITQLLAEQYGVAFFMNHPVLAIEKGEIQTYQQRWKSDQVFVCTGANFQYLFPEVYTEHSVIQSKLQMMRTYPQPKAWQLGPSLCGGLTLTHYAAFEDCPSLTQLKKRIEQESPHFPQWGIHILLTQNHLGELVIGDSHEYGLHFDPFIKEQINAYIVDYLKQIAVFPNWKMQEKWTGVYAKLPGKTELIVHPQPQVTIVNALGGAGMTLSFGLAEEIIENIN